VGKPIERDRWEELGVDGSPTLKCILKKMGWNDLYLIYIAQDRGTWRAVVNMVKKHRFVKYKEFF
jgi:hypothetical protein